MSQSPENTPITIALLTPDFLPNSGGIANTLERLIRTTEVWCRWHVFTTYPETGKPERTRQYPLTRLIGRNVMNRPGDKFLPIRKLNSLVFHLMSRRGAHAVFERLGSEVRPAFVLFGCWDHSTSYWCSAARRRGIPYWLLAHGREVIGKRLWVMRRRRAVDFRFAEHIIANSEATARCVQALGVPQRRLTILHPPVNLETPFPLSSRAAGDLLTPVGLSDIPFILSMGRLVRRKGFDLTVSAFVRIADEFQNLHLAIAGDGPERSSLESLVATLDVGRRVHLLGHVSEIMKTALLQTCEFFVLANREFKGDMEGFGIVFREAALFGKACIGGDNGGVPEAVKQGQTGLLVDTSASDGPLSEAMRLLLGSPSRARELGLNGQSEAAAAGTWQYYDRRFRELVEARGRNITHGALHEGSVLLP